MNYHGESLKALEGENMKEKMVIVKEFGDFIRSKWQSALNKF